MAMKENPLIPDTTFAVFTAAEAVLDKRLQKYSEAAEDALRLDDMNLQEKTLVAPSLHHGFVNALFAEKRNLKKLIDMKEQKEEDYLEKYGKPDVPRYRIADEMKTSTDIVKFDKAIEKQKEIIRYVEEICGIMKGFGYSIKNCVEMAKLTS
jgi:hypothetical protein